MTRMRTQQAGFSAVEVLLLAVFVGLIGFVGWYVYNAKHSTDGVVSSTQSTTTSKPASTTSTSKPNAQTAATSQSLDEINSSISQNDNDLNSIDQSLNDSSTFTSVPQ